MVKQILLKEIFFDRTKYLKQQNWLQQVYIFRHNVCTIEYKPCWVIMRAGAMACDPTAINIPMTLRDCAALMFLRVQHMLPGTHKHVLIDLKNLHYKTITTTSWFAFYLLLLYMYYLSLFCINLIWYNDYYYAN